DKVDLCGGLFYKLHKKDQVQGYHYVHQNGNTLEFIRRPALYEATKQNVSEAHLSLTTASKCLSLAFLDDVTRRVSKFVQICDDPPEYIGINYQCIYYTEKSRVVHKAVNSALATGKQTRQMLRERGLCEFTMESGPLSQGILINHRSVCLNATYILSTHMLMAKASYTASLANGTYRRRCNTKSPLNGGRISGTDKGHFKHRIYVAIVGTGHKACSPNQLCADVIDNVAIKTGHHHDIKLLGPGYQLHGGVIHNHALKNELRIAGCHLPTALEEETISQFHDDKVGTHSLEQEASGEGVTDESSQTPTTTHKTVSSSGGKNNMFARSPLIITLPIGLHFTTKSYAFEGAFGMSNRDSYFYAAIVAVVAVHVVLALFVYPTSTDGPVAHVARFAGAAVSLDGVGADGILITVVLPAATFVMLCLQDYGQFPCLETKTDPMFRDGTPAAASSYSEIQKE
ncbi:hypothetical protein EI555_006094, partial [Monodon monoceros]